jgi:hypothetical protein
LKSEEDINGFIRGRKRHVQYPSRIPGDYLKIGVILSFKDIRGIILKRQRLLNTTGLSKQPLKAFLQLSLMGEMNNNE